jgi:carboxymethylenebutenolidase
MLVRDGSIEVETPTGPMRTYVYEPAQPGRPEDRVPGVVLYSEIFQQTPPIRRLAVQIAGHGYLVMVPEVYHSRLPPGTVLGYDDEGKTKGNALKAEIELATFDRDTDAVLRALAEHPRSKGRLGVIGFCLGGHLAFRAALRPEVRAAACVCATDIHSGTLGKGQNADSLARAREIRGELLMLWGRQDPHIPAEGRRKIYDGLEAAGVHFTWHEFNAVHAYMRDQGERYDADVSHQCLRLVVDLFRQSL